MVETTAQMTEPKKTVQLCGEMQDAKDIRSVRCLLPRAHPGQHEGLARDGKRVFFESAAVEKKPA